ncbi:MAG: NAD(P)-dependent oxidoreductase [Pseudomonadota bacterium]
MFGAGLIGQAVCSALARTVGAETSVLPYDWNDSAARLRQGRDAVDRALARATAGPAREIAVLWAAGTSGFGSDAAAMVREERRHAEVLALARALQARATGARVTFHHVSSAGGLFEGARAVGPGAHPHPLRPYGTGKQAQEAALADLPHHRIYRATSVYGYTPGGRAGLVPTLIRNALAETPSHIEGALTTLRDYVLVDDVARFIAARMRAPGPSGAATHLLAQFRPASIFEIVRMIEQAVGRPLNLRVNHRPANAHDISFLPSAAPAGWRATDLTVGIARVHARVRADMISGGTRAA